MHYHSLVTPLTHTVVTSMTTAGRVLRSRLVAIKDQAGIGAAEAKRV